MYEQILFHPDLTLSEKMVMQAITSFYSIKNQKVIYHTEKQIADALNISVASVERAIKKLTKLNVLSVTRRRHQCKFYEINFGYLVKSTPHFEGEHPSFTSKAPLMVRAIHDGSLH
jgi:DNA-binding MarR family transcriptional regulator